jgi:hypothetical protein
MTSFDYQKEDYPYPSQTWVVLRRERVRRRIAFPWGGFSCGGSLGRIRVIISHKYPMFDHSTSDKKIHKGKGTLKNF